MASGMVENRINEQGQPVQAADFEEISAARPKSDWSPVVGWLGAAGVLLWVAIARIYQLHEPFWSVFTVLTAAVPMVLWSVLVDKVHRNPSTGIDWDSAPRPYDAIKDISFIKIVGLWATWGVLAFIYCVGRWYWNGGNFAMEVFMWTGIPLLLISIPYVIWIDRRLEKPKDYTYAFGLWVIGQSGPEHKEQIYHHVRTWGVKGFFIAFMVAILPGGYHNVITMPIIGMWHDPRLVVGTIVALMFLFDVHVAMVGYLLTLRPLDSHIRSANPFLAGWVAALMCYPPFILMAGDNAPFNYHYATYGEDGWWQWTIGYPAVTWTLAGIYILLSAIYAWATIVYGLRFSNLTHRGVVTDGPYKWTRHPAYISKNSFWWIATMPFLVTTGSYVDAVRNVAALCLVNAIYYWRAKTEEEHLRIDPKYVDYWNWAERHAPITKTLNKMFRKVPRTASLRIDDTATSR